MARLPLDKLYALQELIQLWQDRRWHTRRELESLIGHFTSCHKGSLARLYLPASNDQFAQVFSPTGPSGLPNNNRSQCGKGQLRLSCFLFKEWNKIPLDIRNRESVGIFKKVLHPVM